MSKKLLCDTHAHLSDKAYDNDRQEIAKEALDELLFIIDVGTNRKTWSKAKELAESFENIFCTAGWHPHDAKDSAVETVREELQAVWSEKTVALGEIGLDYHYDFSPRKKQQELFAAQLDYAAELKVPTVIHIREAWEDAVSIMSAADLSAGGVVHCFTGTMDNAQKSLELGLHISFTGVITFPRSKELREVVKAVPVDKMFFETDCPYLSPPPYRGKRNHPVYVRQVAEKAAEALQMDFDELLAKTTENALRFFRLEGRV